jgi:hypothetical protein
MTDPTDPGSCVPQPFTDANGEERYDAAEGRAGATHSRPQVPGGHRRLRFEAYLPADLAARGIGRGGVVVHVAGESGHYVGMRFVRQADLFAGAGTPATRPAPSGAQRLSLVPEDLDDAALIAAIPRSSLGECHALVAEAGRRRLAAAVPALESLCRRFRGFGLHDAVSEQVAALTGLAALGGRDATAAVARIIVDDVVQGPGLASAISAAAELRAILPAETVAVLLRHDEPAIRADACRCAPPQPRIISLLVDLLDDLHGAVASAAACALGHMGRIEARPLLLRLLREDPTVAVIDAAAGIADADCIVRLGRIARSRPDLAEAAIDALKDIDDPRTAAIVAAMPGLCQQSA